MSGTSTRIRLSAAIIALNEQDNLPGLLDRLDWVDEIVLIDGGSSDETLSVARRFTDRVWQHPFDNFARQRNRALDRCRGQWVISIDADERPSAAMRAEIDRRLEAPDGCVAFRVPIHSTILGQPFRYSGTQDDRPIRLFRREGVRWVGAVHEVPAVKGLVGELCNGLEHCTLPDLEALITKLNRYTTLEAQQRFRAGSPWRSWNLIWQPAREVARRLIWKKGILDGPRGWLFCALTGFSSLMVHLKHGEMLREARQKRSGGTAIDRVVRVGELRKKGPGPAVPALQGDAN
jgi:glycosyltransferase involved in cell wall biosynthesis